MSQKRIFIIGHPGAGKALLAKSLAEKLDWQFIDADLGLETRIGRTLPAILGKEGEEAFLKFQREILVSQQNKEYIVVTTDASVVLHEQNQELLSSEFTVYLKVSTPIQLERTSRSPEQLLPSKEIKEFFEQLHDERDDLYKEVAKLSIDSDDSDLEGHVLSILNVVQGEEPNKDQKCSLQRRDFTVFHKTLHTPVNLTTQQAKILKLLAQGKSSKEIARELNISYRTVEGSLARIMEAVGCSSSKELITLYLSQP